MVNVRQRDEGHKVPAGAGNLDPGTRDFHRVGATDNGLEASEGKGVKTAMEAEEANPSGV